MLEILIFICACIIIINIESIIEQISDSTSGMMSKGQSMTMLYRCHYYTLHLIVLSLHNLIRDTWYCIHDLLKKYPSRVSWWSSCKVCVGEVTVLERSTMTLLISIILPGSWHTGYHSWPSQQSWWITWVPDGKEQLPRSEQRWWIRVVKTDSYLGSKDGEDEPAWVEGVEHISDNAEVGGSWNVWLKADITEVVLRSDVYGDIFTKTIVLTLLAYAQL